MPLVWMATIFTAELPSSLPPPPSTTYNVVSAAVALTVVLICTACCVGAVLVAHLGRHLYSAFQQHNVSKDGQPVHPLLKNVNELNRVVLPDGDIDVFMLERMCSYFAENVLERMGTLGARMSASVARDNVQNVRDALTNCELQMGMPPGRSLRALYQWERKQKMHQPGGVIADPSAAMGVLWLRLGLQTWSNFFMLCERANASTEGSALMEQAIEASHGELLGWWARKAISLFCRSTGQWEEIAQQIGPSRAETEEDARKWCAAVTEVTLAMRAVQREFDYEDKRKSS